MPSMVRCEQLLDLIKNTIFKIQKIDLIVNIFVKYQLFLLTRYSNKFFTLESTCNESTL